DASRGLNPAAELSAVADYLSAAVTSRCRAAEGDAAAGRGGAQLIGRITVAEDGERHRISGEGSAASVHDGPPERKCVGDLGLAENVARAQGHRHYVPWKIGVWRERAGHGARLDGLALQRGLIRTKGHEENLVPGIGAVRREL